MVGFQQMCPTVGGVPILCPSAVHVDRKPAEMRGGVRRKGGGVRGWVEVGRLAGSGPGVGRETVSEKLFSKSKTSVKSYTETSFLHQFLNHCRAPK